MRVDAGLAVGAQVADQLKFAYNAEIILVGKGDDDSDEDSDDSDEEEEDGREEAEVHG